MRHGVCALATVVGLMLWLQPAGINASPAAGANTVRSAGAGADFFVTVGDFLSRWDVIPLMVMPGERVSLEASSGGAPETFRLSASTGRISQSGPARWQWDAPSTPGNYALRVEEASTGRARHVTAFVLRPYQGEPSLNGYRIGSYQERPLRGNPAYARPTGFIEVTPENEDVQLSPNFRLGQFLSKQASGYPKYVAVQPRLIMKLERLVERLRHQGIGADSLHVMSAYRTPAYNAAIGNGTTYSRHAYGDAADVFIDRDHDGRMDDLDGDGRTTSADAQLIYDEIDSLSQEVPTLPLVGGLGLYGPTPHRGPFVHLDTRGHRSRW